MNFTSSLLLDTDPEGLKQSSGWGFETNDFIYDVAQLQSYIRDPRQSSDGNCILKCSPLTHIVLRTMSNEADRRLKYVSSRR